MCDKDFSSAPFIHLANEQRKHLLWLFGKWVRESNANRSFDLHTHFSNDNTNVAFGVHSLSVYSALRVRRRHIYNSLVNLYVFSLSLWTRAGHVVQMDIRLFLSEVILFMFMLTWY